ncbi:alpha/beta fold hydrolase [Spirillospora sp. CA-253888]
MAPDHIGMGLSDKPGEDRYTYTLDSRVDDLDALTDHLIATGRAPEHGWTLVMHDWGGPIGMAWAARHPERIARLVVLNTAAFPYPRGEHVRPLLRVPFHVLRQTRLGTRLFQQVNLFARGATWRPLGVWRRMPADVRAAFVAPYDRPAHRLPIQRFVQDIPMRPGDRAWNTFVHTAAALQQFNDRPVLLAWGLRDFVLDTTLLHEWQQRFPAAVTRTYPRAGHYLLEDVHQQLIPAIGDFLRTG